MQIVYRARTKLTDAAVMDPARANLTAAEAAVARWQALFGTGTRDADFEDFHESAAQLFAALDTGLPTFVVPTRGIAPNYAFNTSDAFDPTQPFILIGSQGVRDPLHQKPGFSWPRPVEVNAADRAFLLPSFPAAAGRTAIPATFAPDVPEDGPDLSAACLDAIKNAAANGRRPEAFVKIVAQQKHSEPVIITGETIDEINRAITDALDYTVIEFEGRKHAFLVQERIDMRFEYRLILVGGRIIAGAGCFGPATPLDNQAVFDPMVEQSRNSKQTSLEPGIVAFYVAAAQEIADRFRAECPAFRSGTIDLSIDENGKVCLIEVNPALNFGLYAMNYARVLQAIIEDAIQQGPQPAENPIPTGQPSFQFADLASDESPAEPDHDTFSRDDLIAALKFNI